MVMFVPFGVLSWIVLRGPENTNLTQPATWY